MRFQETFLDKYYTHNEYEMTVIGRNATRDCANIWIFLNSNDLYRSGTNLPWFYSPSRKRPRLLPTSAGDPFVTMSMRVITLSRVDNGLPEGRLILREKVLPVIWQIVCCPVWWMDSGYAFHLTCKERCVTKGLRKLQNRLPFLFMGEKIIFRSINLFHIQSRIKCSVISSTQLALQKIIYS